MTTRTQVAADSPLVYFYFDETSGAFTNHGSFGGTSSNTGNISYSASAPSNVGQGNAIQMNPTAVTYASIGTSIVSGTTWTFETWVKRATMTNPWVRIVGNIISGTNITGATSYGEIAIIDDSATAVTGSVRLYDQASGTQVAFTHPTISDLNWHHIAIVFNSGTCTIYVDGVSLGSGTMTCASKTGVVVFGTRSVAGTAFYLDEGAFFQTALSSDRIAAHYTGNVSTTQTPPPMTMTLSAPVPPFVGQPVPPMTLSLSAPAPGFNTHVNVTADGSTNQGGSGTSASAALGYTAYLNTGPFAAPAGTAVSSATLNMNIFRNSGSVLSVYRITSAWTEGSIVGSHPTYDPTPITTFTPNSGTGWNSVDITSLVLAWQNGTYPFYGVAITATSPDGSDDVISTRESTAPPYIAATYAPSTSVSNSVPPMTGTLSTVAPTDSVSTNVTEVVPPMNATLSSPGGVVVIPDTLQQPFPFSLSLYGPGTSSVTTGSNESVPPFTATLSTVAPTVTAEITPDDTVAVPPFALSLSAPAPVVDVEYPVAVSVPAITLSLDTVPATVSLTTNVLVSAPAATLNLHWVGIYNAANDRYLTKVPTTVDQDDIWYKMDETSGTRAVDASFGDDSATPPNILWQQSGYYFGGVSFQVPDGPQLRKALHFNGVDSYMVVGPYARNNQYYGGVNDIFNQMALTIEFSIRTTQTDGVVFVGTGGVSADLAAISPTARDVAALNGNELRLEGGNLVIHSQDKSVKVRKNIADGQWHHVVMAIPSGTQMTAGGILQGGLYDLGVPSYVAIDGVPTLVRYSTFLGGSQNYGEYWLPYSVMGKAVPKTDFNPNNPDNTGHNPVYSDNVSGLIAGDMRDFIVRLNSYVPLNLAESLYYEWSDSTLVEPTPMTLSGDMVAGKAKGNTKKMLAIYGLEWNTDQSTALPLQTYMSNLSGMVIENLAAAFGPAGSVNVGGAISHGQGTWWKPKVFSYNGFTVYPVSILGDTTLSGPVSVDGVLSPDATTNVYGTFVDDTTGLPRFINLQNDLSLNVADEYDVVTVVNYPWVKPNALPAHSTKEPQDAMPIQHNLGLSNSEWSEARDALRDSILQAAYDGVSLWIGEYEMARHLGFIQGYDIHDPGYFPVGVHNNAAEAIDNAHLAPANRIAIIEDKTGDYQDYPQINFYRRIVNLEAGLTDVPSNEYGDWVEAWNIDDFKPYATFLAYDIVRRPNGLQINDKVKMSMSLPGKEFGTDPSPFQPYFRRAVISAHPDGIVGKVIAREQDSYYGPNGAVVDNPFKNNAITIAAERGSVVRGRPIAGRAFIELMDTETTPGYIIEDTNKLKWHGDTSYTSQVSAWDFDTRRAKETKAVVTSVVQKFDPTSGAITMTANTTSYITVDTESHTLNLHVPMHARGLNWLSQVTQLAPGDAVSFADPITLTVSTPDPAFARTANPVSQVFGPMRLFVEMRALANFLDGNVQEYVQPMEMSLDVHGTGNTVQVPPMSLTVTTVAPALDVAADLITVYIDEDRSITLFLKEDN